MCQRGEQRGQVGAHRRLNIRLEAQAQPFTLGAVEELAVQDFYAWAQGRAARTQAGNRETVPGDTLPGSGTPVGVTPIRVVPVRFVPVAVMPIPGVPAHIAPVQIK